MKKICENCGNTFECKPQGCWCFEVNLIDEQRKALKEKFEDCLCPECLKCYAHGPKPTQSISLIPSLSFKK